ncbi:MAG: hypothetical protein WAO52_11445 [Prolixibacteraceae bacterium]
MFVLLQTSYFTIAENADSTKQVSHFSGSVLVTNKGISLIPSLTLGKPAAQFEFSMGKGKLTFEPQFRFALEGKPWSFIFWWRYKFTDTERFRFNIGAHPALSFKTVDLSASGGSADGMIVRRYLAAELAPTFVLSKKVSVGPYYLIARGVEEEIAHNTHYLTLRGNVSNMRLSEQLTMEISPQVYYLRIHKTVGYYWASGFSLAKTNLPVSFSALINKKIDSDIAGDDFIWNVSLIYSFGKKYKQL